MKHKQKKWRDLSNIQKYFSCQCFLRCQRLAQRFKLNFPKLSWIFKLLQNTVSRNPQPPYNVPCKASFHFPVECGSCFCMTWRNGFGLRMPIMEEEHARRKHILRPKFTYNCFSIQDMAYTLHGRTSLKKFGKWENHILMKVKMCTFDWACIIIVENKCG